MIIHYPFNRRLPRVFESWLLAEALFYLLVYIPMSYAVHGPAMEVAHTTRKERRQLFQKCLATIDDPVRYVSLWHRGAPAESLGRENAKEWVRWAFLNKSAWCPDEDDEVEEYVSALENLLPNGMKFRPGRVPGIKTLRFSLDPVNISHKPLIFYILGVGITDIYTAIVMSYYGYQHYSTKRWFTSFPSRPQNLLSPHRSAAKYVSYWHRPHTSKKSLPILYIHGIGILHTYGDFFAELAAEVDSRASSLDGTIGIIVLEILPISFRIAHPALSAAEMCSEIQAILHQHSWSQFVLMANSFGTATSVHLLRNPSISPQIRDVVFIDPIPFLLHLPDTAYNFTRRLPQSASEHQLYYFASTDIGAAHTLSRRFSWVDSIYWKEDLKDRRWTIMLSERDIIVAVEPIGRYLTRREGMTALEDSKRGDEWKTTKWCGGDLDVLWLEGLNHAEVFDTRRDRKRVIEIAMNYSRGASSRITERPSGYGKWVEKHGLWFKCSPARWTVALGVDNTLAAR